MTKLVVDKKVCLRSGQCMYLHPKLFKEGEGGYPDVVVDEVTEEMKDEAEDAMDVCPSGAIFTED